MSNHWAVIPVKGLAESKTRLSPHFGERRKILIEALLTDVLRAVVKSKIYDTVLIVSNDNQIGTLAGAAGVSFLRQSSFGLNRGLEQVNEIALEEGAYSLTTILADIPLVEPKDFREIFAFSHATHRVVMAPSLKGGTNIMLTSPPGIIRPNYGRWSYSKHLRQAQIGQVDAFSISNPRVSFDVDTIDDLKELKRRDPKGITFSARAARELSRAAAISRIQRKTQLPTIG